MHAVGRTVPKAQQSLTLLHAAKRDCRSAAAREGHDIFANWVRRVHERDAERSKCFLQSIVAHRKATGWETDNTKTKWLRLDVELDGIEPAIRRSIIVSPLISIHRLHHQVLAPTLGRRSNAHCYAFRQCHNFSFPEQGCAESSSDQVARHLELVHANWIGPKVSSALDGFFQPFYIGGEMADDQKIMLGDLFYHQDHDDTKEMYIRYIHDFGDWWSHTLTVTKYSDDFPPDASVAHILSGYGACPPDDCGGMVAYVKRISQLSGGLDMNVDRDDHDAERVPREDGKFVYPLKEMWWKVSKQKELMLFRS
jgi:Plasmid pRiA4b ORF-3-like protein